MFEASDVVVVELSDGEPSRSRRGARRLLSRRRRRRTSSSELEACRGAIEAGASRDELRADPAAGGARNAVDCALWELEAARPGGPAWQLAGSRRAAAAGHDLHARRRQPEEMARRRTRLCAARAIKIKLTGELELDIERVRAVRAARPDVWLGVDANQGFDSSDLDRAGRGAWSSRASRCSSSRWRAAARPISRASSRPIPIAADESVLTLADVPGLVGRFDVVNIKLDKCGGLTEGAADGRRGAPARASA